MRSAGLALQLLFARLNLWRHQRHRDISEIGVHYHSVLGRRALAYDDLMSDRAQTLLREALTLSLDERADVAAELLASLDEEAIEDPAAVQAAWATEIERRARRVLTGESVGEPWEDVRERIIQSLKNR